MAKRKNASDGGSGLVTGGLIAVGAYVAYELFFSTPAAATTVTTTAPPLAPGSGGAGPAPTPTSTTTTTSTSGSATSSTASTSPSGSTLDSIYSALIASIPAADGNFSGTGSGLTSSAYHFGVYLALVAPGYTIPDPAVVFGNATQADMPMTAAVYWAAMGPALAASNPGLSGGLGCFAGVGAYMRGLGSYRW